MSLVYNSVKFLFWAKKLGVRFDRTLMLGHQGFSAPYGKFCDLVRNFGLEASSEAIDRVFKREPMAPLFADEFFRFFGGKDVESVDMSDFEGATVLHDLNKPFPQHLNGTFDLVVDGGTLEHLFDYQKALANCLDLLRVGGHFMAFTPANGQMGHGFYQFSPELFFRLFSPARGFALVKIILYDCSITDAPFYEVVDPAIAGQRNSSAARPMMLAVLARKVTETPANLDPPQQSDYVAIWKSHEKGKSGSGAAQEKAPGFIQRTRIAMNPYWPLWLREFRDEWLGRYRWRRGLAQDRSLRQFRKISPEEMYGG